MGGIVSVRSTNLSIWKLCRFYFGILKDDIILKIIEKRYCNHTARALTIIIKVYVGNDILDKSRTIIL